MKLSAAYSNGQRLISEACVITNSYVVQLFGKCNNSACGMTKTIKRTSDLNV